MCLLNPGSPNRSLCRQAQGTHSGLNRERDVMDGYYFLAHYSKTTELFVYTGTFIQYNKRFSVNYLSPAQTHRPYISSRQVEL